MVSGGSAPFDAEGVATTPRVVGGPYRYGEPGAKHAIIPEPEPAVVEHQEATHA